MDERSDPKPRKHIRLYQAYKTWDEWMQMRKKHTLRLKSIEGGKSDMEPAFEREVIATCDQLIKDAKKTMAEWGKQAGPIWDWLVSIRGIAAHTAAKLIALIDYPGPTDHDPDNFATISQLWRYAGWAVIDGEAERNRKGERSHFNNRLKSECYLIGENFIRQQTPLYADIYYKEKARLRHEHPEPEPAPQKPWDHDYTDMHIHRMARRKMIKIFLSHLWLKWREYEGLPVSEPYISAIGGHDNIIPPPEFD